MKFEIGDIVLIKRNGFVMAIYGNIEVGEIKVIKSLTAPDDPKGHTFDNGVTFTDGSGGYGIVQLFNYLDLVERPDKPTNHEIWYI